MHDLSIAENSLLAESLQNLSISDLAIRQTDTEGSDIPMIVDEKSPVKTKPTRALNSPNFRVDPQSPSCPDTPKRYSYFWPEGQESPRSRPMKAIYCRKLNFDI